MSLPSREEALELLHEYTQNEGLRKHAYAVEAAMRAYARKFGEDEDYWGLVGLLHDFDYERYPTEADHPFRGAEILERLGYPEDFRRAVLSHASHTGVPRERLVEKTLFAVDELCGFITAVALVRPSKAVAEVTPKSVKKKLKDKAFARSVSREDIQQGMEELGVDFNDHVAFVTAAMTEIAGRLDLAGDPQP
ncbi:MAG: HDIG domain-containing protein [Candidatus Eisenbacteria bacterium]|nr:HDIG domain-containing protein [Candidatus Eisenbacteria bacterium]